MQLSIEEVYCIIYDLVKPLSLGEKKRGRKSKMNVCEMITVLAMNHMNGFTTNKQIYQSMFGEYKGCFNNIPSYEQFTRTIRSCEGDIKIVLEALIAIYAR
jgi:hypothetical protein